MRGDFEALLKPQEHPVEAALIAEPFNRQSDLYHCRCAGRRDPYLFL